MLSLDMQPPLYFIFSLINGYITEDISSVKVLSCLSSLKIYIFGFNRFIMMFQLQVYSKVNWLCIYPVFPCGSDGKDSACNVGGLSLIPWLGRSPGKGKGYPLQYSGLENSMDCISQFSSVTQSCLTLCNPMDHSMPDSSWQL